MVEVINRHQSYLNNPAEIVIVRQEDTDGVAILRLDLSSAAFHHSLFLTKALFAVLYQVAYLF